MKQGARWVEPLILALMAGALLVVLVTSLQAHPRIQLFASPEFAERATIIRLTLLVYAALSAALALASVRLLRRRTLTLSEEAFRSLVQELADVARWLSRTSSPRDGGVWLLAAIGLGFSIRAYFETQPMRLDEAVSFMYFVKARFPHQFFYPYPNNHLFHTLLARVSVALFGGGVVAIRLPALLAGMAVIPTLFVLDRLLFKRMGGFAAASLAAVFPFLVLYDTMARGYSWVVLFSLWLAILGLRFSLNPTIPGCFLMALVTALGMFTMPSFLFPAAGLILWVSVLLLAKGTGLKYVAKHLVMPFSAMTIVLTWVFYSPVIVMMNGVGTIAGNRYVAGMTWPTFLTQAPGFVSTTLQYFGRDVPVFAVLWILGLIVWGTVAAARRQNWDAVTLLPALVVGTVVVFCLNHNIPKPRTWIFLLPFSFLLVDAGWSELSALLPSRLSRFLPWALLGVAGLWAVRSMKDGVVPSYPDTTLYPEAPAVAEFLSKEMQPGDSLEAEAPVRYYLWRKRPSLGQGDAGVIRRRLFLVVKPSWKSFNERTLADAERVMVLPDAEVYLRYLNPQ